MIRARPYPFWTMGADALFLFRMPPFFHQLSNGKCSPPPTYFGLFFKLCYLEKLTLFEIRPKELKMTRLTLLFLSCWLFACSDYAKKEMQDTRPNILFIMSDDHAYQAISAYGSKLISTPNIDRLAKKGMRFDRAFVTNSICAPSRAVALTGQFSHLNGVLDNRLPFDSTQVTFPKLLQSAGYQTAVIGKWHLKSQPMGFDYWKVLPGQGQYYNPAWRTQEGITQDTGYVTDLITDEAIDWLEHGHDPDKPFLLMYHHKAPHRQWMPGGERLGDLAAMRFPEPATLFDDYSGRGGAAKDQKLSILHDMSFSHDMKIPGDTLRKLGIVESERSMRSIRNQHERMTEEQLAAWQRVYGKRAADLMAKYPMDEKSLTQWKYQNYMRDYLGCIQSVDDNIGRLLDYLEGQGLAENTIVVYTSDQGFYLGEHGWFDKRFMYEESFRTPLLVTWPGVTEPNSTNDDLVQNLDFAPTLLEAAGLEVPKKMQGKSFLPLLKGEPTNWRDAVYYHYYEYPGAHSVKRHYGVRTERHKLIHFYYDIDEWELYDLQKDPHELQNVVADSAYQDILAQLKTRLEELRHQYGDSEGLTNQFLLGASVDF